MHIQSFKEIIDSNDPKKVKSFLDSGESWVLLEEDTEVLQYCLKKKSYIEIFKLIFDRLKSIKKDRILSKVSKDGNSTLFLALGAGEGYFEVFKNYKNIDWSILDKNGNSLLHYALSLEEVSEELLNFLYEKLGGYKCLFRINDDNENALHCSKSLKNFKWCLDKYKTHDPSKIKPLLHSINRVGETPVIKQLLKDKASLDEALLKEITDVLRENEYDFLKTDDNEQNAINLAVRNSYSILLDPFLHDVNNSYEKEKNEIIFSAIENGRDDLLKILEIKDKSDFVVQNFEELSQKYPKRVVNLIVNDQSILSDCIKLYGTRNGRFTSDKLFSVLRRVMNLAVDYTNDNLADQYLTEHRLLKNYVSFYEKNLVISDLLEKQNITDETILDYAYRSNPEMFAKLVQRLPEFKLDISLRSSFNHEHNDSHKKEEIAPSIAGLFISDSCEWYDTGGVLSSLADLVIRESKESDNDFPKILVQPGAESEQLSLSDELKKVSKCGQDVIYIRRNPINKKGESSPHWVVFYFFQGKNGKRNLLLIDPYKINEPSTVVKEATNEIIDSIYVSTTKIQYDNNSCGLISSEVARAIYFQKGRLQELLKGNNQKVDIEQILPNGLIKDAKENGKVDYGRGFENFNCSKIRNVHIQTAQAVGEAILNKIDAIPSQVLINKILTGKENSIDEQNATLGRDSINDILNLCSGDDLKIKREIISILTGKNITDKTLDQEITLLLSQDEAKVNQQQVEKLEQVLGKEQFKRIKERLNAQIQQPQLLQLSNNQKEKIRQIRRSFELELMNVTPEKYKGNDSLLYKFLCSATVNEIEQFFNSDNNPEKGQALSKAAFTAARNGNISRIKVFIKCKSDVIYEKDISGKSLLEVAAENLHPEVVQYIICKHNETYKKQNDRIEEDNVLSKFLGFVDNIDNRKDPWAKNLAKELKRILKKKGFDETDRLKIDRIFSIYIKDKETQEKIVENINTNNYSNLAFYADIIESSDIEKFKTALEKIYPKHNLYSLLSSDGHNLITLTCTLGTLSHWKEIEKAYSKIDGRAAASASLDDSSSIGSAIQAAIIANNLPMFNHFFYSKDEFIIDEQYGEEQNNILHTILQSDKVELLNDVIFKFKDNKKPFIKALQQPNKDGKNPLDLALEKSRYGFFERALDVITSYDKKVIRDLLIANDCGLIKSAVSFGNETIVKKIFDLQVEYNKSVKDKKDQLNLLNYNSNYDKENRLEKSELLNLACKCNNKQVASCLLKLLMDKEKVSGKILVNALTASISKDFSNKEIFDFLFSQGIDFNTISKEITAQYSPIHRAVEYSNVGALGYFVNRFPKNNILDLQDEGGRTPLHLAISSSDRKTVEFLIENGADFDKPNNRGITPFELALENNKFADICIGLLKNNPRVTMPLYRAISSGNESLIKSLIDRNDWVLNQCNIDNAVRNRDFINEETVLKFALKNKINKGLTANIADKSIENFKELDKESQKNLLRLGFLNDLLKSSIYDIYPDESKKVGKISEFIKSAIKRDCSLLSVTSQGTTLLYDIASSGNFNLLRDVKINIEDSSIAKESGNLKETALHAAVRSDNISMVKTIIKTISGQKNIKLAINKYSVEGYTPFQIAAKLGNWEIYNFLKERGGDLKSKTKDGNSIAHLLILSAMKDPLNRSYKYQELLRDSPELVKSINSRGDDLLATAARCTKQDEASKIMEELLENEFKDKKNQLKEEDAVKLLSNAISANNFVVIRNIVLDNIKERVSFTSKVASMITRDDNDNISQQAKVLREVIHSVTSKKKIHGINESKVLSQSIQKALLDTEEQKRTLSQNILKFLKIKSQKGSSSRIGIRTLLNFLIEDQNSYIKSIGGLPYQSSTNLSKIYTPQDALYVDCTDLVNGSLSDPPIRRSDLPLINKAILENKDLLDPEFTDSKGNTLLHKLAQIVKTNKFEGSNLKDYIQLFIDRGFSLTRKNNNGESAKDIFENIFSKKSDKSNKEAINYLSEKSKAEQQAQKHLKKGLNPIYRRATFNPFYNVISSCFNCDLSNDYLFNKKLNYFEKLLKNNDLRTKLDSFDEKGCNFLHKAIEEATNNYSGSSTNKMLKKILLDVARELNDRNSINRDPRLYNELFFKQRNSEGDNVIEALSKVQNSLDIFRELEEEFGRKTFADECDLDLILANAASSKNISLFEHVIENYRLNEFRTTSNEIQSPLHAAVISGDQKTVLTVLKYGANINQINSVGRTALHELLIFLRDNPNNQEHEDLVYYLASRGAFFCHSQKEGENKGCDFSEVIESMNEDIQKKVLFNIAYGRSAFYKLKFSLLNEVENFIKLKNRNAPLLAELDVSGSTAFVRINNGKFKSSKFLNSDICKSNYLTNSYFDVDGCKGYVQKSVSGKRNYVIHEDAIDDEKKNHPTKIKVWLSKEQSITVLVSADGTIEPAMTSHKVMGLEIKDYLLEYRERKGEFKKNHKEYKDYIEKLWEKVDSQNECKNDVYIGGIPLKEALIQGYWRSKVLERKNQENKMLEIQKSPGDHEMSNYSKRNSEDDVVGKTIDDAKIYQQDSGKTGQDLNQLQSIVNNSATDNSNGRAFIATKEGKKNFYEDVVEDINGMKVCSKDNLKDRELKNTHSQNEHPGFDEFVTELKEGFAQPYKELKRVDSDEYYVNPKTLERLIMKDSLKKRDNSKYLESKKSSSFNSQILNNREIKSTRPQQVKILTCMKEKKLLRDTRSRELYNESLKLIERIKDLICKVVDEFSYLKLSKMIQDIMSQMSDQSEVLNQNNNAFYGAVTELSRRLEAIIKESTNNNLLDKTKSDIINNITYNRIVLLISSLNGLISKIVKSDNSLKLRKSAGEHTVKVLDNNKEKYVDLSIKKEIQRAYNSKQRLPESFKELKNKHPKLYEIVVRNLRDIEEDLKEIILDINYDNYVNSNNVSIPGLRFKSDSKSLTQEEKGIKCDYRLKKSEIDVSLMKTSRIELGVEEEQNSISLIIEDQEKGTEDSSKIEKQNKIQSIIENLASTQKQNTKNYMCLKAKAKFNLSNTNYQNDKNLKILNIPILSSCNNKRGRIR